MSKTKEPNKDRLMLSWALSHLQSCNTDYEWRVCGKELRTRLETYLKETDPNGPELPHGY